MTFQFAISGAGYISEIHARAVLNLGGEITALVQRFSEKGIDFAARYGVKQYATIEEALADSRFDAFIVGTPNFLHKSQTIAALQAGIPVLVEKPMAMNADEARQMVEASQASGAALMVAHCFRFDPEVQWLKKQASRLGKIVRTKGYGVHVNWGPAGWFTQRELAGGGAMADMGVHALDTARFLLGDPQPESVYARIGTYYREMEVDDTGLVLINWDNGATSYFESGWWQPHSDGPQAATQLYGTLGFGQVFPALLKIPDPASGQVEVVESGFPISREDHAPQAMYDDQLKYFIECIESGQTPVPGGMDGWVNMKVVDAAYESARTGKVVEIAARP